MNQSLRSDRHRRRHALAALLGLCTLLAAPWAQAAPPVYAVLSLVGDSLGIVVNEASTGSHLDRNRREEPVPVTGDVFDSAVVLATAQQVARLVPGAELSGLNTRSPVLFKNQAELFRVEGPTMTLPPAISDALAAQGATHLILITKHRSATRMEFDNTAVGSGSLEGLGFYVDGLLAVRETNTGKRGQGFVAPYFYARMALVDLAARRLVRTQVIAASDVVLSTRAEVAGGNPWQALTPVEKVNAVRGLIVREVERAVPLLLKPA